VASITTTNVLARTMLWPWFLVVVTADFSCTEHEVELWDDVRLQMDKMLPRYAGRLSFAPWKPLTKPPSTFEKRAMHHNCSIHLNSLIKTG